MKGKKLFGQPNRTKRDEYSNDLLGLDRFCIMFKLHELSNYESTGMFFEETIKISYTIINCASPYIK